MKNLNFVDPEVAEQVVSKHEILNDLKESLAPTFFGNLTLYEEECTKINDLIEWLDSITNEVALTPDEAAVIYKLLGITDEYISEPDMHKPSLLFFDRSSIFPVVQDVSDFILLLPRFFRTDLWDNERIKSIPLLFEKYNDKEIFHPFVGRILGEIRVHCANNKEFAQAYQVKLDEIRNNNGTLPERLALYVVAYPENNKGCKYLIFELEQPTFEMARAYLNTEAGGIEDPLLYLSFVSLLQTPDGMQVPRWNEENYLCRLLLDYEIKYHFGILDKLFRDYTTTDIVLIICNHLKWHNDNTPRILRFYFEKNEKDLRKHRKEYAKFLEAQLPELFSGDIPQKYSDLLHDYYFKDTYEDRTRYEYASTYLYDYLIEKIASAISDNNHEQIRDISCLFDNENKDWMETLGIFDWEDQLQPLISSAKKFFENDDHAEKWRNILRDSEYNFSFRNSLLHSFVKNQKNKTPSLSLEDFVQKYIPQYIPLEIFPEFLHLDFLPEIFSESPFDYFFREQNVDAQSMIEQYPDLRQEDALLYQLLPCLTALAIKNTDEILTMLHHCIRYCRGTQYDPERQLLLCVLDQLCEKHKKEHALIELIFEIIFISLYSVPLMLDIIKKYPQVQQLVFEHCYTILKGSWDTPIYTPLSSYKIEAHIPACIIGMHKGLWHGLKPLLIALRKTRMEWVDASLNIDYVCHPNGNSNLVKEIELYFDFCHESSLKDLRQDMANGLSDWLKPLPESKRGNLEKRLAESPEIEKDREGFDITYTEPDPIWRYAYVRAIADLGVDVDGKGHYIHSVMDKVAKEDPSEMVRTAAEKASAKLKKLRNGWDGDDHYQKIKLAFWWIKQASRLALNLPIDEISSLKTRRNDGGKIDYYKMKQKSEQQEQLDKIQEENNEYNEEIRRNEEKLIRTRLKI